MGTRVSFHLHYPRGQATGKPDRDWFEILRMHNDVVSTATARHNGVVIKGQGDGYMLTFPSAHSALACASEIQRSIARTCDDPGSPIRVRIGVHTGEPVRDREDFIGHALNYASRVAGEARGGQVVVCQLVRDLVAASGDFDLVELPATELKGIEGPQQLWELLVV